MPFGAITTYCRFAAVCKANELGVCHSISTALEIVPAVSNSDQPTIVRPFACKNALMFVENQRWYCTILLLVVPLIPRAAIWLASEAYVVHFVSPVAMTSSPPQWIYRPGKRLITSVKTFVKNVQHPGPDKLRMEMP